MNPLACGSCNSDWFIRPMVIMMVLTAAQTMVFFETADQKGIPHESVLQLQTQGITLVADLAEFETNTLQQLTQQPVQDQQFQLLSLLLEQDCKR